MQCPAYEQLQFKRKSSFTQTTPRVLVCIGASRGIGSTYVPSRKRTGAPCALLTSLPCNCLLRLCGGRCRMATTALDLTDVLSTTPAQTTLPTKSPQRGRGRTEKRCTLHLDLRGRQARQRTKKWAMVETSHLQGALEIAGGRSNILLQRDALVKSKQGAQCTGKS